MKIFRGCMWFTQTVSSLLFSLQHLLLCRFGGGRISLGIAIELLLDDIGTLLCTVVFHLGDVLCVLLGVQKHVATVSGCIVSRETVCVSGVPFVGIGTTTGGWRIILDVNILGLLLARCRRFG